MPVLKVSGVDKNSGIHKTILVDAKDRAEAKWLAQAVEAPRQTGLMETILRLGIDLLIKGIRCISFWLLLAAIIWWAASRHRSIDVDFNSAVAKQVYARSIVERVPRGATVCSDGTFSRSSGRGTCSWHGGVSWQFGILQIDAMSNPAKVADRRQESVNNWAAFLILLSILCAPIVEPSLRGRLGEGAKQKNDID